MKKTKKENKVQCPLCGYKFNKSETENSCAACPFHNKSCGNIKCPNCGYDFPVPENVNFNGFWKKLFK